MRENLDCLPSTVSTYLYSLYGKTCEITDTVETSPLLHPVNNSYHWLLDCKHSNGNVKLCIEHYRFSYVADLQLVCNTTLINFSRDREVHLYRTGEFLLYIQVLWTDGVTKRINNCPYTLAQLNDVVRETYLLCLQNEYLTFR